MYGSMISSLRKKNRLNQKELGDKLGIGVSSISMWEAEKREPSLDNLIALSELFGVSTDYILFGASSDGPLQLSKEEQDFLALLSRLSENQKHEVRGFMKGISLSDGGFK